MSGVSHDLTLLCCTLLPHGSLPVDFPDNPLRPVGFPIGMEQFWSIRDFSLSHKQLRDASANGRLVKHAINTSELSPPDRTCLIWPSPKTLSYQLVMSELDETAPSLDSLPIFLTTIFVRLLSESQLERAGDDDDHADRDRNGARQRRHLHLSRRQRDAQRKSDHSEDSPHEEVTHAHERGQRT